MNMIYNTMPYTPTKVKCPKCERLILKEILQVTGGRCPNCGYFIVSPMSKFFGKKIVEIKLKA